MTNREEKTEAAREVPLLFLAHTSFHLSTPYVSNEEEEEGISNTAHPYFPYPSSWGEEEEEEGIGFISPSSPSKASVSPS